MFLSFCVPNRQIFAPGPPDHCLIQQSEYLQIEYFGSLVTPPEYLVVIVQYMNNAAVKANRRQWDPPKKAKVSCPASPVTHASNESRVSRDNASLMAAEHFAFKELATISQGGAPVKIGDISLNEGRTQPSHDSLLDEQETGLQLFPKSLSLNIYRALNEDLHTGSKTREKGGNHTVLQLFPKSLSVSGSSAGSAAVSYPSATGLKSRRFTPSPSLRDDPVLVESNQREKR
ncbi:hypothetical protein C8R46DRAFT_1030574 [Mycena filopes]|nr:hypothetical protein C8R46DRAFT_1030574 [Mycena filopes]